MSSARKAIRAALAATLVNKTSAADRVFVNRTDPLLDKMTDIEGGTEQFPLLLVYSGDEQSEVFDESPRRYKRTVEIKVEGTINAGAAVDDALDDLADEIETAVLLDDSLGDLVNDVRLKSTSLVLAGTGGRDIGGIILTFDVEYFTTAPDTTAQALDDLDTIDTHYDLGGAQPDVRDQAETLIEGLNQ